MKKVWANCNTVTLFAFKRGKKSKDIDWWSTDECYTDGCYTGIHRY